MAQTMLSPFNNRYKINNVQITNFMAQTMSPFNNRYKINNVQITQQILWYKHTKYKRSYIKRE